MSDLIRREDVFKALGITDKSTKYGGDHSGYNTLMLYEIMDAVDSIPNAETTGALDDAIQEYIKDGYILAEPKVGKWKTKVASNGWNDWYVFECPLCGARIQDKDYHEWDYNYCPNCGAKMKGGADE